MEQNDKFVNKKKGGKSGKLEVEDWGWPCNQPGDSDTGQTKCKMLKVKLKLHSNKSMLRKLNNN